VRNTVVRAILQAYGKWLISTLWGAETAEPIEIKLGMGDKVGDSTPHAQEESTCKGGRLGVGVKCSTQACFVFFFFFLFFGSLNGPPAYPARIGWALSAPKKVFWW